MPGIKVGFPTATCRLCGESFRISPEEESRIYGYPTLSVVCPLCCRLIEEAENSIHNEILSNPKATNKTEVYKDERYDEKCEPFEASDDKYEDLCLGPETGHKGGGSKEKRGGKFQTEAAKPVQLHIELLIATNIIIG